MKVYINTIFNEICSREAREVILPGDEGELSLMDFHQPVVYRLTKGVIKVRSREKEEDFHVLDGIAFMENNTLKIMAEA